MSSLVVGINGHQPLSVLQAAFIIYFFTTFEFKLKATKDPVLGTAHQNAHMGAESRRRDLPSTVSTFNKEMER